MIPTLYTLPAAAEALDVTVPWLRDQLRQRRFGGVKVAGRWRMTEDQIGAAITTMSTEARPAAPPSPAGLAPGSHFRRRIQRQQLL